MTPNRIQTTPQSPTHSGPFRYVPPIRGFRFDAPHNITPNGHSPINPHVFNGAQEEHDSDEGSNEENGEDHDEGVDEEGADGEEEEGGIEEGMRHSKVPMPSSRPPRGIHYASSRA